MSHKEEDNQNQNLSFLINKGSIPLDTEVWNSLLEKIKSTHPGGEKIIEEMNIKEKNFVKLKNRNKESKNSDNDDDSCFFNNDEFECDNYNISPIAELKINPNMSAIQKILGIQKYLNKLQYNHTGMQFFNIRKNRSITRLYDTAKEVMKYSLPIKCLEAVVLSLYLTATIKSVSRFTIRFKTKFGDNVHKHIVLGIHYNSQYGALGLSRRKTLMDKPITYPTLTDLILEYKNCYEECFHVLKKVKLSPCLSSDIHSNDHIAWNHFVLDIHKLSEQEIQHSLDKYAREMRKYTGAVI